MVLRIVVFGSGAVLMALEILAFRIIAKTFGNQLRETTAIVAVFLVAMSCGYYLGGKWGDRWPNWRVLALPMAGAGLVILVIPALDVWVSERVFNSWLPLGLHAIITCLTLFAVPCLLLATVSPVAVRLSCRTLKHSGSTAGNVAALSALGSIVGTVLMGFYLIDAVGSITRLVYGLGATMLLLSSATALGAYRA